MHHDASGHGNSWRWFRQRTAVQQTAQPDEYHTQTRQIDPGAQSYAYVNLELVPFTPIGTGIWNRLNFMYALPASWQPFQQGMRGVGGLVQQSPLVTQLLLSQADAVARGLRAAGQPVPAGVIPNG